MSSEERVWTSVKRLGGCPVCGREDWCTYKDDESTGDRLYCCMRDHESEEFPVQGKRGKEDANGNKHTIYIGSPSDAERAHSREEPTGATGAGIEAGELDALPPVIRGERVFYFHDEHGALTHAEIHKSAIYHRNGSAWVIGRGAQKKPLYRLPHVLEAIRAGEDIWITEGYKDAATLVRAGVCATSGGSASTWLPEYTHALKGAKRVILCGDMDQRGREHLAMLKQTLALAVGEIWEIAEFPGFDQDSKADVTDYLEADHTLAELLELRVPVERRCLQIHDLDDIGNLNLKTDWLIENLFAPQGIVMLLGQPAAGKSLLALDLAISLAFKDRWLDHFPIERNCNVLLLSGEGGAVVLEERKDARSREERLPTGKRVYYWTQDQDTSGGLSLSRERLVEIVFAIRLYDIGVIILDPLIEFNTGDENSSQEMAELVKLLREIIHATDVCVVVTHHTRKGDRHTEPGSMLEGRGSGVLVGAAETVLSLKDKGDERHLFFSKIRRGRKPEDLALAFGDDLVFHMVRSLDEADKRPANLGGNQKVKPDKLLDLVTREGPITPREIEREWGIASSRTIKAHLNEQCDAGRVQKRQRPGRGREVEYFVSTGGTTTPTTTSTASDASGSLL